MKTQFFSLKLGFPKTFAEWFRLSIFLFLAVVVTTFAAFWQITHPGTIQSGLIPTDINRDFEEITLTTIEGLQLHGWYLPPVSSSAEINKAVIFLHGYPAEKSNLLPFVTDFKEYGVLLFDFRSFGLSQGNRTSLGAREVLDVEAAVDFLADKGYTRIGVFGFSMGGGVALRAAALDTRINAVATYAAPASMIEIGEHQYRFLGPLRTAFVRSILFWAQVIYGVEEWELIPEYAVPGIRVPVFLLHSYNDTLIPISHAKRLEAAFQEVPIKLQTHWYQTGSHQVVPLDLSNRLFDFFEESL